MDKDVEFWEHWCPVEQDIIGTEKVIPVTGVTQLKMMSSYFL